MTVKDSTTLKGLETKYKELETKRNMVIKEAHDKQKQASKLKKEMGQIKQQIDHLKQKKDGNIIVSEHAMLRYIERVLGIDLDDLQKKILDENDAKVVGAMGNGTFPRDGFSIKVKDGTVVTVLGEKNV